LRPAGVVEGRRLSTSTSLGPNPDADLPTWWGEPISPFTAGDWEKLYTGWELAAHDLLTRQCTDRAEEIAVLRDRFPTAGGETAYNLRVQEKRLKWMQLDSQRPPPWK
jgi:hypothetical protein